MRERPTDELAPLPLPLPTATRRAVEIVRAYDEQVSDLAIAILKELDDDALTTKKAMRMIMRLNQKR